MRLSAKREFVVCFLLSDPGHYTPGPIRYDLTIRLKHTYDLGTSIWPLG